MLIICKGIKLSITIVGSKNAIVPHLKSVSLGYALPQYSQYT